MTRWDIPPVSLGKSSVIVAGVLGLGSGPVFFVLLRCFLPMAIANLAGGFACRLLVLVLLVIVFSDLPLG